MSEESKLSLLRDESAAAHLDAMAGSELGAPLPTLYLGYSRIYNGSTQRGRDFIWIARCVWLRRNRPWLPRSIMSWRANSPGFTISFAPSAN